MKKGYLLLAEVKKFLKEILGLFKSENLKHLFSRFTIFVERPRLLIWLLVSFLLFISPAFSNLEYVPPFVFLLIFLFWIVFYLIIMIFFTSNVIECVLRACEGVRRVATEKEKQRLKPVFYSVYSDVCKRHKGISRKIKLYVIDSIKINACVIGRNTLAITRGAMQHMTDEELQGIIAHEFGHLYHGDGVISLLLKFCTTFYIWIFIAISSIFLFLRNINNDNILGSIFNFFNWLFGLVVNIMIVFLTVIVAGGNRKKEYRADAFACSLGYGQQLKKALYKIYEMELTTEKGLIKHLQRSHPFTAYRIEKLEEYI